MAIWKPLKIGAGWIPSGIDVHSDGTKVVRMDTYGGYLWTGSAWPQLVTMTSMPVADSGMLLGIAPIELVIAPSNSSRFYMLYNGYVFISGNRGSTWTRTAFSQVASNNVGDDGGNLRAALFGRYIAVDPHKRRCAVRRDVCGERVLFSQCWRVVVNGQRHRRTDEQLREHHRIRSEFDRHQRQDPGRLYLGLRHGCLSFDQRRFVVQLDEQRANDAPAHDLLGCRVLWLAANSGTHTLWKYSGGTWTNPNTGTETNNQSSIVLDPATPTAIYVGNTSGYLTVSTDSGGTWTRSPHTRVATDVPWLANTNETFMSAGHYAWDPTTSRIYFAEGIGVWYATPPALGDNVPWTSQTAGIENLVSQVVISPPSGKPVVGCMDRPAFYIDSPDTYKSHNILNDNAITPINHAYSLDYASSDPTFVCGIFNNGVGGHEESAYSTDGGQAWTQFATKPAHVTDAQFKVGGCIAASTPTNIVWVPSNNASPYYTKNGGTTWTEILRSQGGDLAERDWMGFRLLFLDRQTVCADRVTANKFYMYNYLKGLYVSTDSWRQLVAGVLGRDRQLLLFQRQAAVGARECGAFVFHGRATGRGDGSHPSPRPLKRSTDGGVNWASVANVLEVFDVGFGAIAAGKTYPTIYIYGWVSSVLGVWRSDDSCATWTAVGGTGGFPLGIFDLVKCISGDANDANKVYLGFAGMGFVYGDSLMSTDRVSGLRFGLTGVADASFTGLLDVLGVSATRAYSTRKLRSAYAGSAIRIRRSSDNAEQDIGFSGRIWIRRRSATFVGANSAYVVKMVRSEWQCG